MVGVLVVLVVADVISDVVKQRGVREQLPVVRNASQPLTNRIEELKCKLLNVIGMRRFVMGSLRQLLY
jgi:hypothetical protein